MIVVENIENIQSTPLSDYPSVRSVFGRTGIEVVKGAIQSDSFLIGLNGWKLYANGDLEANDGIFRGSLNINDRAIIDSDGNMKVNSLARSDFHWFSVFESTDGYSKITDGAGTISATESGIEVSTGNVTDNDTEVKKSLGNEISWDKNSKFKCEIAVADDDWQRIEIGIGTFTDYPSSTKHYSFLVNGATLYAVMADGSTSYETELQEVSSGTAYLLEAILDADTGFIKFYVNNELMHTSDGDGTPTGAGSYSFRVRARTKENAVKTITIKWWDFWQEI